MSDGFHTVSLRWILSAHHEDAKLYEMVREAGGRNRTGLDALVPPLAGNFRAQAALGTISGRC